jgi:hypothetical protein
MVQNSPVSISNKALNNSLTATKTSYENLGLPVGFNFYYQVT